MYNIESIVADSKLSVVVESEEDYLPEKPYFLIPSSSEIDLARKTIEGAPNVERFKANYLNNDPSHGKYSYRTEKTESSFKVVRRTSSPDKDGDYHYVGISIGNLDDDSSQVKVSTGQSSEQPVESTALEPAKSESVINLFSSYNKSVYNLFNYLMIQVNRQCYSGENKSFFNDTVSFTVDDLVKDGLFKSEREARTGFDIGARAASSLKLIFHKGQKWSEIGSEGHFTIQPFREPSRIQGVCKIKISTDGRWRDMFNSFNFLPLYTFKLSTASVTLLNHICYIARQNKNNIKSDGYFTVKMSTIRVWMNLPDIKNNHNPYKVRDRIVESIKEINKYQSESSNPDDMHLDLYMCDEKTKASEFINSGLLKVSMQGDYATYLSSIAVSEENKLTEKSERDERIAEKIEVSKRLRAEKKK